MLMLEAIVNPMPGKHPPNVGLRCVMIANQPDIDTLHHLVNEGNSTGRRVLMSRLTWGHNHFGAGIIGPFIGAPYAVILLENLVAWGVREVVFFGWCGAVSPDVHTGDIIIPNAAFIDDGTSGNYITSASRDVAPSFGVQSRLKSACQNHHLPFHEGPVWSTDAIFRETREKVLHYQAQNALAVEMEAAGLFAVGAFRRIDMGCVLVVSDELSSMKWEPGFRNPRFIERRRQVSDMIGYLWHSPSG
jgi:purine-nucleoside phosphorylase